MEKHGVKGRGEKRGWEEEAAAAEPNKKQKKVPALASVIVEAMKLDSLQRFWSSLEPLLRRIVSEEVERAVAKLGPAMLSPRSSPARIDGPSERNLRLHFSTRMPPHLFTGARVEGHQSCTINVVLRDAASGAVVSSGPESAAKLVVVVLQGDFDTDDDENWTAEHFQGFEVKEREGKRPLLTGDLQMSLKAGVGTLGELTFTDNSSWIKARKFRLGVKVAGEDGGAAGLRIREARSDAFSVKEHRGELYKKHYPPRLHDEVWRLHKIAKDGVLCKKLTAAEVHTVEDFLRLLVMDHQRLRTILGSGMSQKGWENMVDHAKTCDLSSKRYVYYLDGSAFSGVVFNPICEPLGLINGGQFVPISSFTDAHKRSIDHHIQRAYENWHHVVEIDGRALSDSSSAAAAKPYGHSGDDLFLLDEPVAESEKFYPAAEQLYRTEGAAAGPPDYGEFMSSSSEMGMRSPEMMDQDDVQTLLSSFTMGDESYHGYEDEIHKEEKAERETRRAAGKRVSRWFKIKAVFKWVIVDRGRTADRRALRLEEID